MKKLNFTNSSFLSYTLDFGYVFIESQNDTCYIARKLRYEVVGDDISVEVLEDLRSYSARGFEKRISSGEISPKCLVKSAEEIPNALRQCIDWKVKYYETKNRKKEEWANYKKKCEEELINSYNALVSTGKPIPATFENVEIVLSYFYRYELHTMPELPHIEGGYSLNYYDCGGQKGVAIKLNRPIKYEWGRSSKFCIAPNRYLTNYVSIRRR